MLRRTTSHEATEQSGMSQDKRLNLPVTYADSPAAHQHALYAVTTATLQS